MIRQNWIDWSKSIGIYLVVLGHCTFLYKDIEGFIYTFHMPLFFMISGYLYKDDLASFTALLTKLKNKLIMPYCLINIIVAIWELIKFVIRGNNEYFPLIKEQLYGTILGIPSKIFAGPTWFLLSLCWCHLFMYVYIRVKNKLWLYLSLIIFPIAIFFIKFGLNFSFFYSLDTFPLAILYFLTMYHLKKYLPTIQKGKASYYLISSCLLFIITFYIYKYNGSSNLILSAFGKNFFLGYLGALTGSWGVFFIGYLFDHLRYQLIKTISNATILILGFHMTLMNFIELHVFSFQNNTILNILISLGIVIIISLSFPYVGKIFPLLVGYRK